MKNRILFLTTERTGSTLLSAMLLGQNGLFRDFKPTYPSWIKTIPSKQCAFYHNIGRDMDFVRSRTSIDVSEAYMFNPPGDLAPSFYDSLPGNNWNFFYLLRDPRNRTESKCVKFTSAEENEERKAELRHVVFERDCIWVRYELDSVEQMLGDSRFHLVKSEDLFADPVGVFEGIFKTANIEIDRPFYEGLVVSQVKRYANSSFEDDCRGCNERWLSWTKAERQLFNEIVGDRLVKFSYEEDDSWLERRPPKKRKGGRKKKSPRKSKKG